MFTLGPALFLVLLELTVGSFLSLAFLDLRGDTSRGFVVFQGVLYLIFAALTALAMNVFAAPGMMAGRGLDDTWLGAQGPLVLLFLALMVPWNILLWRDAPPVGATKSARFTRGPLTPLKRARYALGGVVALTGFAALVVEGMAYRTLADSQLAGAFVVLAVLAGAVALGGVMTAMLLGHWYLNTPTASGKPLEFATALMLAALALGLVFTLFIGPSTAHVTLATTTITPGTTIIAHGTSVQVQAPATSGSSLARAAARTPPITTDAMTWLEIILGFLSPLALGGVALYLTRGRSFQSATGMLYLCVAFIFIGEILGRGLLLAPVF